MSARTWHVSSDDPEFFLGIISLFRAFRLGAECLTVVCVMGIWPM